MGLELDRFMDSLRFAVGEKGSRVKRVLVVGCGTGEECVALLDTFQAATLLAFDVDEQAIRSTCRVLARLHERAGVKMGTISESISTASGPFDLIIVRHANVDSMAESWHRVFSIIAATLVDPGIFITTTYSFAEAELVNNIVLSHGLLRLPGSPYSSVPVPLSGADHYILTFRSRSPKVTHEETS